MLRKEVSKLTNPTMIIKVNNDDYMLIQAANIEHDTKSGKLRIFKGTLNAYKMNIEASQQPFWNASAGGELIVNVNDLLNSLNLTD